MFGVEKITQLRTFEFINRGLWRGHLMRTHRRIRHLAVSNRASLEAELAILLLEEQELSIQRRKLHERIDRGFPNESVLEEERRVSKARRELHARIDLLRARIEIS